MHRALEMQGILSNIFEWERENTSTLASFARTCRAFKEPALDVLWGELHDPSRLARCLPDASHRPLARNTYAFNRPLTQIESDILYSYTRRVRSITDLKCGLDWASVTTYLNPPATRSLFPNLHTLHCDYTREIRPLLHLPLPSLVDLDVKFDSLRLFEGSLMSFPEFSPNIRKLRLFVHFLIVGAICEIEPNYMHRWQNLTSAICPQLTLDVHDLVHLSHLTELGFNASIALQFDSPISFPNLHSLTLQSESLETVSHLLSQIKLPVLRCFDACFLRCPSRPQISSFWAGFQLATVSSTIKELKLVHFNTYSRKSLRSEAVILSFEDLQPCMALNNLRCVEVDIGWKVGLTDGDLLTLATAWPSLESLSINSSWGWSAESRGITPSGLLQVLRACRSLKDISLAIDTRGYTESPSPQESPGLTPLGPRPLSIFVISSVLDAESIPAMTAFFTGIAAPYEFSLYGGEVSRENWKDVNASVCDAMYHSD